MSFDLRKAYPNNTEIASILHLKKEEAEKVDSEFQFTISEIAPFVNASLNQALFDQIFGEGVVNSEEEFKAKIVEEIAGNQKNDSMMRFTIDVRDKLVETLNIPLPVDFLKRWLFYTSEGKTSKETIESEFGNFEKSLKWDLIVGKISDDNHFEVTDDEIKAMYASQLRLQFQQYGLFNITDNVLMQYAESGLQKEEERRRTVHQIIESKAVLYLQSTLKLDVKKVSRDEFNKLYETVKA